MSAPLGKMMPVAPKPRRIILDLFGDYLRYCPGSEVRLGHLIALLDAFDVVPATVRVTMSRLRRDGWFDTRRDGRETIYGLTPTMLDVLDDGRKRIFASPTPSWSGTWTMVIYRMSEEERQEREQLRKELLWHGFGFLGTSTWLAPGDRRVEARRISAEMSADQVEVLRCLTDGLDQDRALAERCWDLPGIAAEYADFLDQYRPLLDDADTLDGSSALVARTLLISAYRHFPYRDPLLPPKLEPSAWPGVEARDLFFRLHTGLGPAARAHVSNIVGCPIEDAESITFRSSDRTSAAFTDKSRSVLQTTGETDPR